MATVNIKPFRSYSDHAVLQLYRYSGTLPITKGNFVKIIGSGVVAADNETNLQLGDVGASYNNTVSKRYGVQPAVTVCPTGEAVIGMLLSDVRETDENGELLILHPRKAAEMQAVPSGQVVPILTAGIFLYSGVDGSPTPGAIAYVSGGAVTTSSTNTTSTSNSIVGKFLGNKDSTGFVLLKIAI